MAWPLRAMLLQKVNYCINHARLNNEIQKGNALSRKDIGVSYDLLDFFSGGGHYL